MAHTVSIHIATATFLELTDYLREYGDERDPSEIVALAIDAWLAIAKGEVRFAPAVRGYQWKGLFLPERTEVRMKHGTVYTYANVVGDALVYAGQSVTPSQFAALVGGLGRNAWRDLWLRLPGTPQWKKAGFHRIDQDRPLNENDRPYRLAGHRHGMLSRRADTLPDD